MDRSSAIGDGFEEGQGLDANRAACLMRKENYDEVIKDCTAALEITPEYVKALMRRAYAYEASHKLADSLKDWESVLRLNPVSPEAQKAVNRLPDAIKQQEEQQKAEAMAKLKELGNSFLGLFGMSLDNFQVQQDTGTGSYSVNMKWKDELTNWREFPKRKSYWLVLIEKLLLPEPKIRKAVQ